MVELELVLPCYNESTTLKGLVERAATKAKEHGLSSDQFQLILVNNGSTDQTSAELDRLAQSDLGAWFRTVKVEVNQGYGFGLWQGLRATSAPTVAWSHADFQCDPDDVFKSFAIYKQAQDDRLIVKGARYGRNWKDRFVSFVFACFAWWYLGHYVREINAQPKLFDRKLLDALTDPPKTFAFDLYVLFSAFKRGYHVTEIAVEFPPRIHGVSNWASTFLGRYKTILGMIHYMRHLGKQRAL